MSYETSQALRMALEQRLLDVSNESGLSLDRLRRRVIFERIVARLQAAAPGDWVLKGGMALEVRLGNVARLTKDIDLGLRDDVTEVGELHDRLIDALASDRHGDRFVLIPGRPERLAEDSDGRPTWRVKVGAELAGKPFGGTKLDVSPRAHELDATDRLTIPNSLAFAGIAAAVIEVVDVHRHAAEKLHAMTRDFGDRENSRVRDLIDLVLLIEHEMLEIARTAIATRQVWAERNGGDQPPEIFPPLPESWPDRYERLAGEHDLRAGSYREAVTLVGGWWADMFRTDV